MHLLFLQATVNQQRPEKQAEQTFYGLQQILLLILNVPID